MKSKNIPVDIKQKSIKEAQSEIDDIMLKLESSEAKLEQSIDQYNRVLQLNQHIHEQFKKKAYEIKKTTIKKRLKKVKKKKWFLMNDFNKNLDVNAKNTEKFLKSFFSKQNYYSNLIKPMKYGLLSKGKRFRSTIIVNTGKIFNVEYKKLIIIGAAVECIHSYSLIHDDLPAMDDDDFRRGKLSTHKKFNEASAILAGNSLLTLAYEILSSNQLKLADKIKNDLIQSISVSIGHLGLAGGQYSDLFFENKNISKSKIIDIQKKKTGELFSFCCESVAIIKKFNYKKRNELKKIGLNIGLLFQIADDLIDYKGDSIIVGKPTGRDKIKGKATLVNLLGYSNALKFAKNLKNKIEKDLKKYGRKADSLLESIEYILNRKL